MIMSRGKHRIYIGMAPGVGKTYRMLQEGKTLKEEGIDVVIGLLDTHGREETKEQAQGLELIPRKTINRDGVSLTEMNTDAIISRQPQLALIDELAHTNVSGSINKKRYQDVELILNSGIDVFSTVNIQHLESLNDLVAKITGVIVREKIPDCLLDEADEVIVVDVTPETLEERLLEGKIYAPDKIQQSLENFFRRSNLNSLRELALREVADNLEESADASNSINRNCSIHERVLVCVSTYPKSLRVLRRGGRIANQMRGRLYVLFINNSERFLTKKESIHIEHCQEICKQFGGEFITVSQTNVTKAIADVAKQYKITQIVLGHTCKPRWQLLLFGSPVYKLMSQIKEIDLHIISH